MKKEKIESYELSLNELLRLAKIRGKLKFLDLGKQNTQDGKDKIYFEMIWEDK